MFSGIIEEKGVVHGVTVANEGGRIVIKSTLNHTDTKLGDSIAINGVCLTVVEKEGDLLGFDAVNETLRRTNLGDLQNGSFVNLERSLKIGDRLHGHFVSGHIDCITKLNESKKDGDSIALSFQIPPDYKRYIVTKGSITISGVSLTVGEVKNDLFTVYIIPHTTSVTTLGNLNPNDTVNIEVDMLARYVLDGGAHA